VLENSYRAAFPYFTNEAISVGVCALDRNEDAPRHHAARSLVTAERVASTRDEGHLQ
jgi:hypothetical protein